MDRVLKGEVELSAKCQKTENTCQVMSFIARQLSEKDCQTTHVPAFAERKLPSLKWKNEIHSLEHRQAANFKSTLEITDTIWLPIS